MLQPPEHHKFITSDPFNIFLLFWTKSPKKRKTCPWLWRRYSCCQNVAGNREFGNSVWCHGSIFSLVAFGTPVARDVSNRNSYFTYQQHSLSYLKTYHVQHLLLGACLAECWFLSMLLYLTNPCTACEGFCPMSSNFPLAVFCIFGKGKFLLSLHEFN